MSRVTLYLIAAYCEKAALRSQKNLERELTKHCELSVEAEIRSRITDRLQYAAVCRAAQAVVDAVRDLPSDELEHPELGTVFAVPLERLEAIDTALADLDKVEKGEQP